MQTIDQITEKKPHPLRVVQFGEGNFLRGFVDYMIDIANERGAMDAGVAIIKPIAHGNLDAFHGQNCVYTVLLRGKQGGETLVTRRVVTCVDRALSPYDDYAGVLALAREPEVRFIVSNTTEAGIVYEESDALTDTPPRSYPGKLTQFLYERFRALGGGAASAVIVLPVELIDRNGDKLRTFCERHARRWGLPEAFLSWLLGDCIFCNTLVDRIVTGYPREEADALFADFGYADPLMVTGEPFALWVIQSDRHEAVRAAFPLDQAGLPVVFTQDLRPYRERKVRVLNGAHTSSVLAAYLAGLDTVGEMMKDKAARAFLQKALAEILPTVPLPRDEVETFAASVIERFENPYIRHNLLSISLNSVSKFRARVLPPLKDSRAATGKLPEALCFSLAALIAFDCGTSVDGRFMGRRGDDAYEILDDADVIDFFKDNAQRPAPELVRAFLSNAGFWGEDLTAMEGLAEAVTAHLEDIRRLGMSAALAKQAGNGGENP